MRQFIVHFGAHKTGTTAFQRYIQTYREDHTARGLFIPELDPARNGNYRALVGAMAGEYQPYPKRVARLMGTLSSITKPDFTDDVLISSEHLSSSEFEKHRSGLAKVIDDLGFQKIAILVVRDQIDWFNSRISQRRKMIHPDVGTFEEQAEALSSSRNGDWKYLCQQLLDYGFDLHVLAYNDDFKTQGAVKAIFQSPPLKPYATKSQFKPNELNLSFGVNELFVADLLKDNVLMRGLQPHEIDRATLANIITDEAKGQLNHVPFNGFDEKFRSKITERHKSGNEWVAQSFFNTSWRDLFPSKVFPPCSPTELANIPSKDRIAVEAVAQRTIKRAEAMGLFEAAHKNKAR